MSNHGTQFSQGRPAGMTACGIIGLVLGVIALILSFIPIINNIAFFLGAIGLILAVVGLVGTFRGRKGGKAVAVVAAALSALSLVVTLAMQAAAGRAIDEAFDDATTQQSAGDAPADDGADAGDAGEAAAPGGAQDMEGDLTDAHVRIVSAVRGGNDYNGQPTVLVTYEWTNTGADNISFMVVADAAAFQNGRELDVAVYTENPEGYDPNSTINELQPGATGTATMGYVLADDSPVSVEVSDLFSFNADAPKITHTFEI